MESIKEQRETGVYGDYDVIVVGGGVAGVAAALAAARNGSKTLLIEKGAVLGGLATAGHVVFYLPLCDGRGHKVISGISEELLHASIKYGYDDLPEEWADRPWEADTTKRYRTKFNAAAFVMSLDELVQEAGIDILLDTVFCDVLMNNGCCEAIIVENKSGRQAYRCKAAVDATGDADVFARAGAECVEQDNHLTYWAYCAANTDSETLSDGGSAESSIKVWAKGNFNGSDLPPGLRKYRGTNVQDVTEFLIEGRKQALDKIKEDPKLVFTSFATQAQFRTTRRIKGMHTLRTEDAGKHFDNSIGCTGVWNVPCPVYEVPFGTLKSETVKNVFAAGRIISTANGHGWEISRPIPTCAMTGQSAGSAAAVFAHNGADVPIDALQDMLKKDGQLLTLNDALVSQAKDWLVDWREENNPWFQDR